MVVSFKYEPYMLAVPQVGGHGHIRHRAGFKLRQVDSCQSAVKL